MALKIYKEAAAKGTSGSSKQKKYSLEEEFNKIDGLSHTNLVTYYGISYIKHQDAMGRSASYPVIIMEYAPYGTLADLLKTTPSIAIKEKLIKDIIQGVGYLHSEGIIHRDLKPGNILITKNRRGELVAKITDFGISRDILSEQTIEQSLTAGVGTPHYMAPEQFYKKKFGLNGEISERTDIWAIGVIVYQCFANRYPFGEGSKEYELTREEIICRTPELESLPSFIQELIASCLEKDAAKRPDSMSLLALFSKGSSEIHNISFKSIPTSKQKKPDSKAEQEPSSPTNEDKAQVDTPPSKPKIEKVDKLKKLRKDTPNRKLPKSLKAALVIIAVTAVSIRAYLLWPYNSIKNLPDDFLVFQLDEEVAVENVATGELVLPDSSGYAIMRLEDESLLNIYDLKNEVYFFYYYEPSHGRNLKIDISPERLSVNDILRSSNIRKINSYINSSQYESIDIIYTSEEGRANEIDFIEKVISVNPFVTIIPEENITRYSELLSKTSPKICLDPSVLNWVSKSEIRFLSTGSNGSDDDLISKDFPRLKTILFEEGTSHYFGLNQAENLIFKNGTFNESMLNSQRNLKGLTIFDESGLSFNFLNEVPELESFTYINKDVFLGDLSPIKNLEELVISGVNEEKLKVIVRNNPNLKHLGLPDMKKIYNMSSLKNLVKLEVLDFDEFDNYIDFSPLKSLENLKRIGIISTDEQEVQNLIDACPTCIVHAVSYGMCLGSGWLTLVFPAFLLLYYFYRLKLYGNEEQR